MSIKAFIKAEKSEVFRYMGYAGQTLTPELDTMADSIIRQCEDVAQPKYIYGYFDTKNTSEGILLPESGIVLKGNDIVSHLCNASYCAVMALTVGIGPEKEVMRMEKTSMTEAVIMDNAANAYTESLADYVENIIADEAEKKGMFINYRYSPGYGDFSIQTQRELVSLLGCDTRIGLTVTQNNILIPRKSITAVVGVFDKSQSNPRKGCEFCRMYHKCAIRKGGGKCVKQ